MSGGKGKGKRTRTVTKVGSGSRQSNEGSKRQRTEREKEESGSQLDFAVRGDPGEQLSADAVNLHQIIADFQTWFDSSGSGDDTRLNPLKNATSELLEQMELHSGKNVIFTGDNGVGKSWIINLLLLLTLQTPSQYKTANASTPLNFDQSEHGEVDFVPEEQAENEDDAEYLELRAAIEGYCTGDNISIKCPFLLPSQDAGRSTTRSLVHIEHSVRFLFRVKFLREADIRANAWAWVSLNQQVLDGAQRQAVLRSDYGKKCKAYYEQVVLPEQIFGPGSEDFRMIENQDQIRLQDRLIEHAGKTKTHAGRGLSIYSDWQFIRDKLKAFTADEQSGYIVASVTLCVPCKIVAQCKRITDSPGCNTTDPFLADTLQKGLDDHEIAVAVLQRNLSDHNSTVQALKSSNFLTNMMNHPDTYHLVLVHYPENSSSNGPTLRDNIIEGNFADHKAQYEEMRAASLDCVTDMLQDVGNITPSDAAAAAAKVTILHAIPTLFASIEFNRQFCFDMLRDPHRGADFLDKIITFTNTAKLLGLVEYFECQTRKKTVENFREELQKGISSIQLQAGSAARSVLSKAVQDQAEKNAVHAVPVGGRSTEGGKLLHPEFNKKLDALLEASKKQLFESAKNFFEDGSNSVTQRFQDCIESAKDSWPDFNDLTESTKPLLEPRWAGRNPSLEITKRIFKPLHDGGGVDFQPFLTMMSDSLMTLKDKLLEYVRNYIMTNLFESVQSDTDFQDHLNRYLASTVEPVLDSRMKKFFVFWQKNRHLTGENLNSQILPKAEAYAMKSFLKEWYTDEQKRKKADVLKKELGKSIDDIVERAKSDLVNSPGCIIDIIDFQFKRLKSHLCAVKRPARKDGNYSLLIYSFDFAKDLMQPSDSRSASAGGQGATKMQERAEELEGIRDSMNDVLHGYESGQRQTLEAVGRSTMVQLEAIRNARDLDSTFDTNLLGKHILPASKINGASQVQRSKPQDLLALPVQTATRQDQAALQRVLEQKNLELWPPLADTAHASTLSCGLFDALVLQRYGPQPDNHLRAIQLCHSLCSDILALPTESVRAEYESAFGEIPAEWRQQMSGDWDLVRRLIRGKADSLQLTLAESVLCIFALAKQWGYGINVWCSSSRKPFLVRWGGGGSNERSIKVYQIALLGAGLGSADQDNGQNAAPPFNLEARSVATTQWHRNHGATVAAPPPPPPRPNPGPTQEQPKVHLILDVQIMLNIPNQGPLYQRDPTPLEAWRKLEQFHAQQLAVLLPMPVFNKLRQTAQCNSVGSQKTQARTALSLFNAKQKSSPDFWKLQTQEEHKELLRAWPTPGFDHQDRMVQWAKAMNGPDAINAVIVTNNADLATLARTSGVACIRAFGQTDAPGLLDLINVHLRENQGTQQQDVNYAELIRAHVRRNR